MTFNAAEADRRISQIVQVGVVTSVGAGTVRVRIGDIETHDIPVGQPVMGGIRFKAMPSAGEQVMVFCPDGDVARAMTGPSLAASNMPPDANEHAVLDLGSGELRITGDVVVTGDVRVTGKITATEDAVADGVSLVGHRHGGVTRGSDTTKEPE